MLLGCSASVAEDVTSKGTLPIVPVGSPESTDATYEREYAGLVQAVRYAEIRARTRGVIESVAIDEGQPVKAGDSLFEISAREAQQELLAMRAAAKSAAAGLELARVEHGNTQMLFDKKIVSSAELALTKGKIAALEADLEQAKAAEERAAIDLTHAKLRAPFDGIVNRIPRRTGSLVGDNDLLTTLADTRDVYVYFGVSERQHLELTAGSPGLEPRVVRLKLADGSLHPSTGIIDAVESEVDRETGNLSFRARFQNATGSLKHGSMSTVVVATQLQNALLVPQKSTFEVQGTLYVYAVDDQNRARARAIVPALRLKDSFAIASGIELDERFVLDGLQSIKDGAQIEIEPTS